MTEVKEAKKESVDVQDKLDGLQLFFEENKKKVGIAAAVLAVVIGGFIAYKKWYQPKQELKAQNAAYKTFALFEGDSAKLALNGDGKTKGIEYIAKEFSGTSQGNLANYMAGVTYLQDGQYEKAIESLKKFDGEDVIVSSLAIGAIGEANMELNKVDDAISYYLKAANNKPNDFTSPIFLKKAGIAYEISGKYADALAMFEKIQKEYPKSSDARDITKYIQRVKTLGNL